MTASLARFRNDEERADGYHLELTVPLYQLRTKKLRGPSVSRLCQACPAMPPRARPRGGGGMSVEKVARHVADEALIEAAREQARARNTSLNAEFRRWLEYYARREEYARHAMATIDRIRTYARTGGRRFTRDEMNER